MKEKDADDSTVPLQQGGITIAAPPPDAVHARMAQKIKTRPYSLAAVQRTLWVALAHVHDVLEQAGDDDLARRLDAVYALSQIAGQLMEVMEVGERTARYEKEHGHGASQRCRRG